MNNPRPKIEEDNAVVFDYPVIRSYKLRNVRQDNSIGFFEVLRKRRSGGSLTTLPKGLLDQLLLHAAKVGAFAIQPNGYILTHRPSPSAGARHPLDLLILYPDMSSRFCYYNPFQHTLNELDLDPELLGQFIAHVNENVVIDGAILIWMIAHSSRTAAKYEHPQSLIWRDAGAMVQTIQLVCTALNIGTTPVGTLGYPYIDRLFQNADVLSCGGIIVGKHLEI